MEGIKPPAEFVPYSNEKKWETWRESFEIFAIAVNLESMPLVRQRAILKHIAGEKTVMIYKTFHISENDTYPNVKEMLDMLTNHFKPFKNTIQRRNAFFTCVQKEKQGIMEFVTELKHLAQECEFENLTESLIRDRLIIGILDREVKRKLLEDPQLTLPRAISIAVISESTCSQVASLIEQKMIEKIEKRNWVKDTIRMENAEAGPSGINPRRERIIEPSASTSNIRGILRKNVVWHWGPKQDGEFDHIKECVRNAPSLAHFDKSKMLILQCDASKDAMGAALLQEDRPLAFASASFSDSQKQYSQIEKELLSVYYGCKKFEYLLSGHTFVVQTDHQPLLPLVKKPLSDISPRLQRLVMKLIAFDFKLQYKPGKYLIMADTLSRDTHPMDELPTPFLEDKRMVKMLCLSRSLRCQIPRITPLYRPYQTNWRSIENAKRKRQSSMKEQYDRNSKSYPKVNVGEDAWCQIHPRETWTPVKISAQADSPQSFEVVTPSGNRLIRNQQFIRPRDGGYEKSQLSSEPITASPEAQHPQCYSPTMGESFTAPIQRSSEETNIDQREGATTSAGIAPEPSGRPRFSRNHHSQNNGNGAFNFQYFNGDGGYRAVNVFSTFRCSTHHLYRQNECSATTFRTYPVAITADIEKMYRQIRIHPEDADYQRILWRPSPEEPVVDYRLLTVTYGTTSAPFLAMRTLQQLAEDEGHNYPEASRVTLNDFYVDDLLTGAQTIAETKELIDQLKDLMKKGGFHLRKWNSNCQEIVSHVEEMNEEKKINLEKGAISKILGIVWDHVQDTFRVNITLPEEVVTKRDLLSNIARIFDPLGFLSPTTVALKIIMQELWRDTYGHVKRIKMFNSTDFVTHQV
ncbi:hypothetical protein LAZ67_X003485 [Cordylochernes scorpioides]|uniref:Reverse transcriptase/retrotransposon-derived protein RNase H-like domain-containing protein n=1 Tax=Cordylochernes scorpioides TaxID=51811 RepID=A0ABY6LWB2_9ARAC|nr:hypothetical protein LAZ67_X003485 [Cordylochernes scorpioides]